MIRLFMAVEVNEGLRAQLAQLQQDLKRRLSRDLPPNVRLSWVSPASIHLTIKFLGENEEPLIASLREAVERMVTSRVRLEIPLERLGVFPRPEEPRVLWIGPSDAWKQSADAGRLQALHEAVDAACQSCGCVPDDRPLSPHLTLARVRVGGRHLGQALAERGALRPLLAVGPLSVTGIALMKSDPHPAGSVYTPLWHFPID